MSGTSFYFYRDKLFLYTVLFQHVMSSACQTKHTTKKWVDVGAKVVGAGCNSKSCKDVEQQ